MGEGRSVTAHTRIHYVHLRLGRGDVSRTLAGSVSTHLRLGGRGDVSGTIVGSVSTSLKLFAQTSRLNG
jgi:hypothetical protein